MAASAPDYCYYDDSRWRPQDSLQSFENLLSVHNKRLDFLFIFNMTRLPLLFEQYADRALLIEGVAGSGKTTLIAQEAQHCVTQGRTLLVTFSRAGRDVLQQYMRARDVDPVANTNLHIFTIDGLAHFLLRRLGDERYVLDRQAIVSGLLPELVSEVCQSLQDPSEEDEALQLQAPALSLESMEKLMADLDYYRASLAWQAEFDEDEQAAFGDGLHHPPALVRAVFHRYDALRAHWKPEAEEPDETLLDPAYKPERDKGMYGFRLVSEATYDLIEALDNGATLPPNAAAYRYVLIDEFHDTTPLQLQLLSRVAAGARRLMAVGDRYQTIFAWRGANTELVFDAFVQTFSAKRIGSLTSYRFGPELATLASELTQRPIRSGSPLDTPVMHCKGDWQDAAALAPLARQTIVCRHGPDRIRAAFSLLCDAPPALKLAWSLTTTPAMGVASFLYALRYPQTTAALRTLSLAVQQFCSLPGCLAPDAARDLSQSRLTPASLRMFVENWVAAREPVFGPSLNRALQAWLTGVGAPDTSASDALRQFAQQADLFRNGNTPQRLLDESLLYGWRGLLAYLDQHRWTMQDWPAVMAAVAARCSTRGGVPLLTVTEAKGHEYDHVLVYDTADKTFRSQTDAPDVERNRYYVACTRARKSLTLYRPG